MHKLSLTFRHTKINIFLALVSGKLLVIEYKQSYYFLDFTTIKLGSTTKSLQEVLKIPEVHVISK